MSTYTPIASQTLASAASSVTFTGVPQNFTDLILVTNADVTSAGASINIRFNSDSGSNYSYTTMYGNGSTAASARGSSLTKSYIAAYVAPNTTLEHTTITHIQNYSNATTNKTFLSRSNRASASNSPGAEALVGLWRNTSAITTIVIAPDSGSFDTGSTFNLYGIVPNTSPKASGGIVSTDGTYYYHTFRSSGIFTPNVALTADCLVVAGGGGGGGSSNSAFYTAGGGAGGLLAHTSQSLTAINYAISVGSGGAGGLSPSGTQGSNGNISQFASLTAALGGGGGGGGGDKFSQYLNGLAGGSGGGGNSLSGTGGAGTSGQGFAGGSGGGIYQVQPQAGGGGGGAGAVGQTAIDFGTAGAGGVGSSAYSSWGAATSTGQNVSGTYYYAGGAGGNGNTAGGAGGYGGGGQGNAFNATTNGKGIANTGGGGGGTSNGGSGVVIIRYAV